MSKRPLLRLWLRLQHTAVAVALFTSTLPAIGADRLPQATPMIVTGLTQPPKGWSNFCVDYPRECRMPDPGRIYGVKLTDDVFAALMLVNARVNVRITPVTDANNWPNAPERYQVDGEIDKWTLAEDMTGDCEEYALVKRKLLIGIGFPPFVLLPTMVLDVTGRGHLVLTVRTDRGDLVLDNLTSAISGWEDTGYTFSSRLDPRNKGLWQVLGNPKKGGQS